MSPFWIYKNAKCKLKKAKLCVWSDFGVLVCGQYILRLCEQYTLRICEIYNSEESVKYPWRRWISKAPRLMNNSLYRFALMSKAMPNSDRQLYSLGCARGRGRRQREPSLNSLNFFSVKRLFGLFCFLEEFDNFNS